MAWGDLPANQTNLLVSGSKVGTTFGGYRVNHTPTLLNGFADRWNTGTAPDQNYDTVSWYTGARGFVTLSGTVDATGAGANWANVSLAVFNIPAPYRPLKQIGWAITTASNLRLMATMDTSGNLIFYCFTPATIPNQISLDGCTYYCGQPDAGLVGKTAGNQAANVLPPPMIGVPTPELLTYTSPMGAMFTGNNNLIQDNPSGETLWQGAISPSGATTTDAIYITCPMGVVEDAGTEPTGSTREIFPVPTYTQATGPTGVFPDRADLTHGINGSLYQPQFRPESAYSLGQITMLNNVHYNYQKAGGRFPPPAIGAQAASSSIWTGGFTWDDSMATDWIDLTLNAPWANYGAPYRKAQIMRDGYGNAYLRGLIAHGTPATAIATIPAEMQTQLSSRHIAWTSAGASAVNIASTGGITVISGRNYVGGTGQWVSLSGIKYQVF